MRIIIDWFKIYIVGNNTLINDKEKISFIKKSLLEKDEARIKELGSNIEGRIAELEAILHGPNIQSYIQEERDKMIKEYFMLIGHIRGYTQESVDNLPGPFRMFIHGLACKSREIWNSIKI